MESYSFGAASSPSSSSSNPSDVGRQVYGQHMEEIQRREVEKEKRDAATDSGTTGFAPGPSDGPTTLRVGDQSVLLLSLSTSGISPRSTEPAFRVVGAFSTADEAKEHALVVQRDDPASSLFLHPSGDWMLAAPTPDRVRDEPAIESMLERHRREVERDRREFAEHKEQCLQRPEPVREREVLGEDGGDPMEEDAACSSPSSPQGVVGTRARLRLPASSAVVGQRLAVVSFVADDEDTVREGRPAGEREVAFRVHGCVDTVREADGWIRNVLSKSIRDHDLHVVSTCEWVFPLRMTPDRAPNETFPDTELHTIMERHRTEPARVKEYEEWASKGNSTL
jgi:hypothetical protein